MLALGFAFASRHVPVPTSTDWFDRDDECKGKCNVDDRFDSMCLTFMGDVIDEVNDIDVGIGVDVNTSVKVDADGRVDSLKESCEYV